MGQTVVGTPIEARSTTSVMMLLINPTSIRHADRQALTGSLELK
jgi:hypothetical protein